LLAGYALPGMLVLGAAGFDVEIVVRNTKYTIKLLRFLSQGSCTVELLICVLAAVMLLLSGSTALHSLELGGASASLLCLINTLCMHCRQAVLRSRATARFCHSR